MTPGDPMKSPLLLHPLAEKAGGDRFHAGGVNTGRRRVIPTGRRWPHGSRGETEEGSK